MLMDNGIEYFKPVCTSMNANAMTVETDNGAMNKHEVTKCRSGVGSLPYIVLNTSPDTSVTASFLGAHVEKPHSIDMVAAKRALRYLKGLKDRSSMIKTDRSDRLTAYIDANWASE